MAGYRRFVAYVYEYRKGKKDANCGFVKIEARNGICTMELHLQCPGLTPQTACRIYGFLRKQGILEGILLGSCQTGEGSALGYIETEAENMGGTGVTLEELGGMVFVTELGAFFGTEWDDMPIEPGSFREAGTAKPEEPPKEQTDDAERKEAKPEEPLKEQTDDAERKDAKPEEPAEVEDREPEASKEAPAEPLDFQPSGGQEDSVSAGPLTGSEMRAEEILTEGQEKAEEAFLPFEDGEFEVCKKIRPQDLAGFSRRECALRHNRFLTYGYYNFGHLLLGKRADGRYILGVPGRYDQQEHFMAGMFGFPYFKESSYIQLSQGKGGYWYRLINAPDGN